MKVDREENKKGLLIRRKIRRDYDGEVVKTNRKRRKNK